MARGIQETDVWTAADELLLAGERPTIERVRLKIGRGSPNTVSPMLDLWFAQLGARIRDPGAFSASTQTPEPVQAAAKHFWETALSVAREEAVSALTVDRESLEAHAVERERAIFALHQREMAFEAREEAVNDSLSVLRAQIDADRIRLEEAELRAISRDAELTQMHEALDRQRQATDALHASFERERRDWIEERKVAEARSAAIEHKAGVDLEREIGRRDAAAQTERARFEAQEKEIRLRYEDSQTALREALSRIRALDEERGVLLRSLVDEAKGQSGRQRD